MKALSVRQPRAEQILQGAKTMDVRSWQVRHRGRLVLHASGNKQLKRIRTLGFDPDRLPFGAIVGTVELVEIVELDEAAYEAARPAHLSEAPYPGAPCYGWRFASPQRLATPIPMRGAMTLFDVPDDLAAVRAHANGSALHSATLETPSPDPARPFVLYAIPEEAGGYRVALYQWLQKDERIEALETRAPGALWGIEVGGDHVRAVATHMLAVLRANGYRPTVLANSPNTPLYLDETSGVRLALMFIAIKPLSRHDRIEAIVYGILDMSDEEAFYWFSKCSVGTGATRGQKALRVLLSEE